MKVLKLSLRTVLATPTISDPTLNQNSLNSSNQRHIAVNVSDLSFRGKRQAESRIETEASYQYTTEKALGSERVP